MVMSRMQLALNVDDLDTAIEFYSKLFNTTPAKRKPGYANFAIVEPPLEAGAAGESRPGRHDQPSRRRGRVEREGARRDRPVVREGLFTQEEINSTCCFATQDKVWVTGPAKEKWEVYTVLADSETFGTSPKLLEQNATEDAEQGSVCCGGSAADQAEARTACC